jgi:indolepyruvate ferredoxin oxidoreductase alpha subunit
MLEPADSEEARRFTKLAFGISEEFDTPVFVRTTTRTSHSKSIVTTEEPLRKAPKNYKSEPSRYVVPIYGKRLRKNIDDRMKKLGDFAETFAENRIERGYSDIGVITSGISYQYAREAFPDASVLKLGMIYPFPRKMIGEFCARVKTLYIVEELEPFIEEHLSIFGVTELHTGVKIIGKEKLPSVFELSPDTVRGSFLDTASPEPFDRQIGIPVRPPVLCPGCPHSGVYFALRKLKATVTGDIGCYTLGALPPFSAIDTTFCMGAGIGNAFGMEKVHREAMGKKLVAVIGDSTFLHSGIAPLIDIVFNRGITTVVLMDNATTGMTGHQQHPGMGKTIREEKTFAIDYEQLLRAIGINHINVIDPYDLAATERALKEAMAIGEPSVVISRHPCVLLEEEKAKSHVPYEVIDGLCEECDLCLKIGCPAIDGSTPVPSISRERCIGCDLCAKLCHFDAIVPATANA